MRHEYVAMQQNCYFYRDSTRFFDSCVPTHVRSRLIWAESDINGIAAYIFCRIGLEGFTSGFQSSQL